MKIEFKRSQLRKGWRYFWDTKNDNLFSALVIFCLVIGYWFIATIFFTEEKPVCKTCKREL